MVGHAEVVAFRVEHPRVLVELMPDRGAHRHETVDFSISVSRCDVKVHRLLRDLDDVHLLEAELEARSHNDDAWVGLGGQVEVAYEVP